MNTRDAHNRFSYPVFVLGAVLLIMTLLAGGCGNESEPPPRAKPEEPAQGFTFLDLGHSTLLTKELRTALRNSLGSDAIEQRTTINLEPGANGLLEEMFPSLDSLNSELNYLPRQRIEHNTTKLRYRYATRKNVPFKYVELLFSNYTQKPLMFVIRAGEEGAGILESLKEKYGDPQSRQEGVPGAPVLYWQNDQDYLVMTSGRDNFGDATYQFNFYFGANLQALVDTEVEERKQAADQIQKAGRQAF